MIRRILVATRDYWPIAALLAAWFVSEAAHVALDGFVLAPLRADLGESGWTGWPRAAAHLGHALGLVVPAAVVAVAFVAFAECSPWPALVGWLVALAGFVVVHPCTADGSLPVAYAVAELAGTGTAAVIVARWYWGPHRPATPAQVLLAAIVGVMLAGAIAALFIAPSQANHGFAIGIALLVLVQVGLGLAVVRNTAELARLREQVGANTKRTFEARVAVQMNAAGKKRAADEDAPPSSRRGATVS